MKTQRSLPLCLALGLALWLAASCTTPEKLLETGDYDRVLDIAIDRLAGEKNKKPRYVQALAEAFERANAHDLATADALRRDNRPEHWDRIHDLYQRIAYRQSKVAPLLPLADKHGFRPEISFVQTDDLLQQARHNAAAYHYNRALDLLDAARQGDRFAARDAHHALLSVERYFRDYRDKERLKLEARALGTTHILVQVRNEAPVFLPEYLENDLRRLPVHDLDSRWQQYHTTPTANTDYDYEVIIRMTHIEASPALVREREFEETCEIEDGFEYILDSRGNVMKDSAGNDLKVPRKVLARARVFEVWQHKAAALQCRVDFYDKRRGQLVESWPIAAEAVFEHHAATFRGDSRALSSQTRARLGNRPMPSPSDEALLLQAAERLKSIIKSRMARTRATS